MPKLVDASADLNDADGKVRSHLERYTDFFNSVEINSSFHRAHLPATYARWYQTVPAGFRFSVKMPKEITHRLRLVNCDSELERFVFEVGHLAEKLGILLIQIPPSLQFDDKIANGFFLHLKERCNVALAFEARHLSWFEPKVFELLEQHNVALVWADPRPAEFKIKSLPQTSSTIYIRLHGSPKMYSSSYSQQYLENLSKVLRFEHSGNKRIWCVFDNTALGAAFQNATTLCSILERNV